MPEQEEASRAWPRRNRGWVPRPRWSGVGAVVALVVSLLTFYFVHCDPADLAVVPAADLGFGYLLPEQQLLVVVPCLIRNSGAQPAVLQNMALTLTGPGSQDQESHFLRWGFFYSYSDQTILSRDDRAIPLSLPGASSCFKYVAFVGSDSLCGWTPKPGRYVASFVGSAGDPAKIDCRAMTHITFSEADCETLGIYVDKGRGAIRWYTADEWRSWRSRLVTPSDLIRLEVPTQ